MGLNRISYASTVKVRNTQTISVPWSCPSHPAHHLRLTPSLLPDSAITPLSSLAPGRADPHTLAHTASLRLRLAVITHHHHPPVSLLLHNRVAHPQTSVDSCPFPPLHLRPARLPRLSPLPPSPLPQPRSLAALAKAPQSISRSMSPARAGSIPRLSMVQNPTLIASAVQLNPHSSLASSQIHTQPIQITL